MAGFQHLSFRLVYAKAEMTSQVRMYTQRARPVPGKEAVKKPTPCMENTVKAIRYLVAEALKPDHRLTHGKLAY